MAGNFFQPFKIIQRKYDRKVHPLELFDSDVFLAVDVTWHTREVYNLFDLLGDLGGVSQVIAITIGFIFLPLAEHNFILDATSKLFLARTKDKGIFEKLSPHE